MAWNERWIAVRGRSHDDIFEQLWLEQTDSVESAAAGSPQVYALEVADGWFMLRGAPHWFTDDQARSLSRGGEALAFEVHYKGLHSELHCYRNGDLAWLIAYPGCGEEPPDPDHVRAQGTLPPLAIDRIAHRTREQATHDPDDEDGRVDVLVDIAVDVATAITGWTLDDHFAGTPMRLRPNPLRERTLTVDGVTRPVDNLDQVMTAVAKLESHQAIGLYVCHDRGRARLTARIQQRDAIELVADVLPGGAHGIGHYIAAQPAGGRVRHDAVVSAFRTFYWGTKLTEELSWTLSAR